MRLELQHVSVPIPQDGRDTARSFYAGLVWFRVGDELELHLFASDEPQPRSQHFCLRLDQGLAELRARLEAANVQTEETEEIVGRPRFMCRDPFGNRIELTEWVDA